MTAGELQERFKKFAYRIVPLCKALPSCKMSIVIEHQLIRSAFSAAANYRAACKGQSLRTFKAKLSIALEEIDESLFWLECIRDMKLLPGDKLSMIIKEADELTRILAATRIKLEKRLPKY